MLINFQGWTNEGQIILQKRQLYINTLKIYKILLYCKVLMMD